MKLIKAKAKGKKPATPALRVVHSANRARPAVTVEGQPGQAGRKKAS
jgi:hypothetical protein